MGKYDVGDTVGDGDETLTITSIIPMPEERTVQMYGVEFADGGKETFSESEVEDYASKHGNEQG